jgi:hypothetical protein
MSHYTETISIRLPSSLAQIAESIGRAMDPDSGGANSFVQDIASHDAQGNPIYAGTISTSALCTPTFKAQADYMLAHPEALHAAVTADYAARWGDLAVPTLEDCQAFCAGVILPEVVL